MKQQLGWDEREEEGHIALCSATPAHAQEAAV